MSDSHKISAAGIQRTGFIIARDDESGGMAVNAHSDFSSSIARLFASINPRKIIETGTFLGTGTTAAIAQSLRDLHIDDADFYTIEVNPEYHTKALENLQAKKFNVIPLNGLSVPRSLLPAPEQIQKETLVTDSDNIFADHDPDKRVELYYAETNFNVADDLLGLCLRKFDFNPDFILLDSAGHIGNIEFNYCLSLLRGPCYIALDDIYHVKHYKSFRQIQSDPRFELVVASPEKYGFCIARFTPNLPMHIPTPARIVDPQAVRSVLIVRPDAIGDFLIFSGVLEHFKTIYPYARVSVLVQNVVAPLAQACPYIDEVIPFDRKAVERDTNKRDELLNALRARALDVAVYPLYSREYYWDQFTLGVGAKTTITIDGGCSNQLRYQKGTNDLYYDILLHARKEPMLETARNDEFICGLSGGKIVSNSMPFAWLSPANHDAAEAILGRLQVDDFIAICPFAQSAARQWPADKWAQLLRQYRDHTILICGPGSDSDQARELMALSDHPRMFNCCGETSVLDMAALIKRARLCIAMESAPAHLAAVVDTPHVVIVGGGHFGRFMPYSPQTHIVAKKMACFNCDWKCDRQFWNADCITAVEVESVKNAIDKVLGIVSADPVDTHEAILAGQAIAAVPQEYKYLVSAIVSTYNSEDTIRGCIEDLEHQTIADKIEIIVVNSNSPTDEDSIIKELAQKYSNIKYIQTPRRETLYKAWNRAIKIASGKYITNANTDDRHRPDALEILANTLEANPDKAVAYADQRFVDAIDGRVVRSCTAGEFSRERLLSQWCFIGSHPMWRKSIHEEFGYFDPQFFICGDYEFWLRVSQRYGFVYVRKILGDRVYAENCLSKLEFSKKEGLCFLEDRLIRLAYRYASINSININHRCISANPIYADWPEVRIWKRRVRARIKGKLFAVSQSVDSVNDTHPQLSPALSIVIATRGDSVRLRTCLGSFTSQTCSDFELVIVDRAAAFADDFIYDQKSSYPLRHVRLKEDWGLPAARNIGIEYARGRFVAFIDDTGTVHSEFVHNTIKHLSEDGVLGLRSRILPPANYKGYSPQHFDIGDQPAVSICEDGACAFRKDVLLAMDGFDIALVGFEVPEICYRLYKSHEKNIAAVIYYPDVITYEDYCADVEAYRRRDFERYVGRKYAITKDAEIQNYLDFFKSLHPDNRKSTESDFNKIMNIVLILQNSYPADAMEWATKALALNPNDISCQYILGSLYVKTNNYAKAIDLLESIVKPLLAMVGSGYSRLADYHPDQLENTAACLVSVAAKLAQCYVSQKAFGKIKTIYLCLLQNKAIILSDQQRNAFASILAKLRTVEPEPIEPKTKVAVAKPAVFAQQPDILVSAIVSTYNSERFIRGCLEDLERQTIADKLEIIVVNSGSHQNEEAIVKEFQARYKNIVYIKTGQREGIYAAWNRAVKVAKGKYLTNANTDDRHRTDALEIMANELAANSDVGLVYADQITTDTPNATFENHNCCGELKWDDYSHERLKLGCCVGSQPMWQKSLHAQIGYFDESLTCAGDWDFWLRIADTHKLKHLPHFLGLYYHNNEGIEHGRKIHSLYERYVVGKRYGTPYIAVIPYVEGPDYPLVSVIMPAYNAQKYIAEAIESVLIQSYRNFELIVVDDGSTDQTKEIAAGFKDDKIRYFYRENGGASSARNLGIRESNGRYLVMLDADDMMTPEYILSHIQHFQKHQSADLVYCDHRIIDVDDKPVRELMQFEYEDRRYLIRDMFRCGYPVIQPRGCIKKSVIEKIGGYDESLVVGEDYDLMRRFVLHNCTAVRLPKVLYLRRSQPESLSRTNTQAKATSHFIAVRRWVETFCGEDLFPEVEWSKITPDRRSTYLQMLIGATYRAIGKNYAHSQVEINAAMALDLACTALKESLRNDPANDQARILLDQCEQEKRQLTVIETAVVSAMN